MKNTVRALALVLVLVMAMLALVSCSPAADPAKALAALKENGYTAAEDKVVIPAVLGAIGIDDIETIVSGTKIDRENDTIDTVTIVYFEDAEAANDAWDDIQDYIADEKGDEEDSNWVSKKAGKMIYWGTKAGVAAAR